MICLSVFCTSEKTHPALSRFIGAATTSLIPKQRISQTDGLGRLTDVWEVTASDSATDPVTFPGHAEVQAGYRTKYSYDALDDLKQATQQIGTTGTAQTRMFSYDGLKRLTQAINPESGTINYTYDANSNLETRQDFRLITTTCTYDALNRVKTRIYTNDPQSTPSVTYKYDGQSLPNGAPTFARGSSIGRLVSVTSGTGSAGNYSGYDQLGRANVSYQQTDSQNYGFAYVYNLASEMTAETYPSGRQVITEYDSAGRAAGIRAAAVYYAGATASDATNRIQYAAQGAVSAMKLGNGKWEHTLFNARLQPTEIGLGANGTSDLLKLEYKYGVLVNNVLDTTQNNGNLQSQIITAPKTSSGNLVLTQTYTYDALNRLQSASENVATIWTQTYDYDRWGNRAVRSSSYMPQPSLTPQSFFAGDMSAFNPSTNRIASGFGYDTSGNVTGDPSTSANAILYDSENRQTSYTKSGVMTSYSYDGDGRRVKKVDNSGTIIFVYNAGGELIAEYTSGNASTGGTSYLTTDQLGSTRIVTSAADGSGNFTVKARYDYLPFGEEIGSDRGSRSSVTGYVTSNSTRQKFTQKERDSESGLDYFLARYYSSAQGRFTSCDAFVGGPDELFDFSGAALSNPTFYADLTDPQSLNKYQYCYNNPLLYIDPDGHQGVRKWIQDTLRGAAAAFNSDNGLPTPSGDQTTTGRTIGHLAAITQGVTEVVTGGNLIVGGGTEAVATSPAATTIVGAAVPAAGVAVAVVGGALVVHGAGVIINTFKNGGSEKNSTGPSAENSPGVSSSGHPTDQHGNKLGPSGKPMVNTTKSTTREAARNRALGEGSSAVEHRNPKRGERHFHPADAAGKKKPVSTHHEY